MVFPFKFRLGPLVCYYVVPKLTRENIFATVAISLRAKCRLTGLNVTGCRIMKHIITVMFLDMQ